MRSPDQTPTPTKSNPWNIPASPQIDLSFREINSDLPVRDPSGSFQQIIQEDITKEENLVKVMSKSLHITQIEEKAIEELRKFYNVAQCQDEIITISRQPKGSLVAAPVWKKKS